jgi:hypothetical protein
MLILFTAKSRTMCIYLRIAETLGFANYSPSAKRLIFYSLRFHQRVNASITTTRTASTDRDS